MTRRREQLADGGAHVLASLAEDRNVRDTLAGGATVAKKSAKAKSRKAKRLSKARKAALGAYLGDRSPECGLPGAEAGHRPAAVDGR